MLCRMPISGSEGIGPWVRARNRIQVLRTLVWTLVKSLASLANCATMHPLCTSSVRASADLLNKSFVWFILTNLTNSPIWPGITSLYNQALPSSSLFKPKCQNASCTLQDVLKRTLRLWVSEHVWTRTLASWMDLLVYEQLSATGRFTRNISRKCNTVLSPKILGVNTESQFCVHWASVPAPHSFFTCQMLLVVSKRSTARRSFSFI